MAKPIMPNSTGTMMTASCRDMEPCGLANAALRAVARLAIGPQLTKLPHRRLRLGYLLSTGTYKLRLVGGLRRFGLPIGHRGEEGLGHIRQLGLLFGAERAHEVRGNQH